MALDVNITGGADINQGGQVSLTATVTENGNTPFGTLVYAWSATRGNFIGATNTATAVYEADFTDANDVDVTVTCSVTRAANATPTTSSASLDSLHDLGIDGVILNMYISDTDGGTNGSNTVIYAESSSDGTLATGSDDDVSSDIHIWRVQWNESEEWFILNNNGTGSMATFFASNTTQSIFLVFANGTYEELHNNVYHDGAQGWARWEVHTNTISGLLDGLDDDGELVVGVGNSGSIGWLADSGSGTSMFTASASPAMPMTLEIVSGNNQSGAASSPLANPMVVRVLDQNGNPYAGSTVAFTTTGGTLSTASATTGANGQASTILTLGSTIGNYTVTATVAGLTAVMFTATATGAGNILTQPQLQESQYDDGIYPVAIVDPNDATRALGRRTTRSGLQDIVATATRLVEQVQALDASQLTVVKGLLGLAVQEEGTEVSASPTFLNFIGDGILAEVDGTGVDVTVDATTVTNVFNTFTETQVVEARDALGLMLEPTIGLLGTLPLEAANNNPQGITYVSNISEVWVANGGINNPIYRYNTSGVSQGTYNLHANNDNSSGITYVSNISEVWVSDRDDSLFYRYNTSGVYQGTYALNSGNSDSQGVAYISDISEVWSVDLDDNIYRYNTSGVYQGTYALESANSDGRGIAYVPDIEEVWITDLTDNKIYRYSTSGASLGVFDLDSNNTVASGITFIGGTTDEAWVINSAATDLIYRYALLFDITLTPERVLTILEAFTAANRDAARTALGLQGTNFSITVSNGQPSATGDIIIGYDGSNFAAGTGMLNPTGNNWDFVIINYS